MERHGRAEDARAGAQGFDLVALASSAGGLRALGTVLGGLPADFPAAVVVVQHLARQHRSQLAEIMGRRSALRVRQASEGMRLEPGTVLVAAPDHHLLVHDDASVSLSHSELVHFLRPSADLLFESVAASFRERALSVVLSGTGKDGALGVTAVRSVGGAVLVQDPERAEFRGMPDAALATGHVDSVLALEGISKALVRRVARREGAG